MTVERATVTVTGAAQSLPLPALVSSPLAEPMNEPVAGPVVVDGFTVMVRVAVLVVRTVVVGSSELPLSFPLSFPPTLAWPPPTAGVAWAPLVLVKYLVWKRLDCGCDGRTPQDMKCSRGVTYDITSNGVLNGGSDDGCGSTGAEGVS